MGTKNATFQQSLLQFTHRRIREITGLCLWSIAAFICLSLFSFAPNDPSLNFVSDIPVTNWMGYPGAVVADFMLQTLGAASGFMVLAVLAWGWRFMTRYHHQRFWLRLVMLTLLLPTGALLLSFIDAPLFWPIETGLGGAIGAILRTTAVQFASAGWIAFAAVIAVAILLPFVMGLSRVEWKNILFFVLWIGIYIRGFFRAILPFGKTGFSTSGFSLKASIASALSRFAPSEEPKEAKRTAKKAKPKPEPTLNKEAAPSLVAVKPRIQKHEPMLETQSAMPLKQKLGDFELPSLDLLKVAKKAKKSLLSDAALEQSARLLATVLRDFGVKGEITNIHPGPVVTLYELEPAAGTKSSRVIGLADDIARSMSAVSARISVIPGRNALGIELPNSKRETVFLRTLLEDSSFSESNCKLPMALGKDIGGNPIVVDLARMPHLLVAGTTGSGKSVSVNAMIASLLYHHSPDQCKFIMIDPKMLELSVYDGIPHLLSPVVTEPAKAVVALKWVVKEMENRYRLMANLSVRNVEGYNKHIKAARDKGEELKRTVQTGFDPDTGKPIYEEQPLDMNPLPFIVVVVDEMADLMLVAGKDIEGSIQRLAQMARAAGIHIIMATQRPSVDVITGVIKANFPTRISFQVTSRIDSRTILGEQGAEQLLGMGDMLYMAGGGRVTRVHGPFISDEEINKIVAHLKTQGEPDYVEDVTIEPEESDAFFEPDISDEEQMLYQKAVAIVRRDQKASTSYIQRCLKIGYNKAARLIEQMEREGIISAPTATGKREILQG